MKKHLLLFASLLSVFSLYAQSTVDINGTLYPIDTTAHYQAGPGIWHTRYTVAIGTNKHHCYILEIDLTNPYNTIEEWQSGNEFGKTQKLEDAHMQMSAENHRPVGGVNCNFWVVSSQNVGNIEGMLGQSFAGTARNGVMIGQPDDWNQGHGDRGYVMIDRNKKAWIEEMRFDGVLTAADATTHPIRDVNRPRVLPNPDEVTLFNHYMGSKPTRATDGIEVVFSTPEWKMNGDMTCTVTSINTAGGTLITEGNGVLQGRGSGKAFLEKFKEGDTFTINLGVVSATDATFRPDIMEMVTGNCLVMRDGVLNNRNTNEEYNNRNYPRTMLATNNEGNKFWMMVAEKPGMFTAQMCALLKHAGATYAAGMDGGGSAQMCLDGQVLNTTTESIPRAVANSIWVLSTAPDDNIVTRLEYPEDKIRLPKYGIFAPAFRSYNQYEVLLSHNQPNVKLSCDESVGYINEDGHFVCLGGGQLTVTCDKATKVFQVELEPTTGIDILLDSVIVMDDTDYLIETYATAAGKTLPIFAAALTWTVGDPSICSVSKEGVLNGISNGTTYVVGEIDGNKDSILVSVEIPQTDLVCLNTFLGEDVNTWKIKASSSSWGTKFAVNEAGKPTIDFTYSAARQAKIELLSNIRLYGVPKSLVLHVQIDKEMLTDINFKLQGNGLDKQTQYLYQDIKVDEPMQIVVDLEKEIGSHISVNPIHVEDIQFNLNTSALKKGDQCSIVLDGLYVNYGDLMVGVDNILTSNLQVYPNPSQDILHISGIEQATQVTLFDVQGRTVAKTTLAEDGVLHITSLASGTYVLQVGNETVKIIKQ